jgi:ATP-dependent Lhr-like helicase
MAKRKFRDIAAISGLIFQGYPGKYITNKHLQSSTQILFQVFKEYDPDNLLLKQSYEEVLTIQIEQARLANTLKRMGSQNLLFKNIQRPSPFAFPIMVDRLRETLSSEKLEDRVNRMVKNLEKFI